MGKDGGEVREACMCVIRVMQVGGNWREGRA